MAIGVRAAPADVNPHIADMCSALAHVCFGPIADIKHCLFDKLFPHFWLLEIARLAVRRFAGLDPGLVKRLGLVVGRIGARDRRALSDTNGDELLEPFLLE